MSDNVKLLVPELGDFSDVEIIEILVSVGDTVAVEDPLITLETDKASMDVPAEQNGVIESLTVATGDAVNSGDVIGTMTVEVGDTVVVTPAIASAPSAIALAKSAGWRRPPVAISVMGSCIVGNSDTSFFTDKPAQQTATGNWWGAVGGPGAPGADTVGGNVDTSGHLNGPILGCALYVYLPLVLK